LSELRDSLSRFSAVVQSFPNVSDELQRNGKTVAAEQIRETLGTFWTTSTEALGELRNTLGRVIAQIARIIH